MIILTKLDGNHITVNADEIETLDAAHETTITLRSGRKIIVRELPEEIIARVVEYKRQCNLDKKIS